MIDTKNYNYIYTELKKRHKDNIKKIFFGVDEENKGINVIVITRDMDPELEAELFKFENEFERKNKIATNFHVFPAFSTVGLLT